MAFSLKTGFNNIFISSPISLESERLTVFKHPTVHASVFDIKVYLAPPVKNLFKSLRPSISETL